MFPMVVCWRHFPYGVLSYHRWCHFPTDFSLHHFLIFWWDIYNAGFLLIIISLLWCANTMLCQTEQYLSTWFFIHLLIFLSTNLLLTTHYCPCFFYSKVMSIIQETQPTKIGIKVVIGFYIMHTSWANKLIPLNANSWRRKYELEQETIRSMKQQFMSILLL